MDDYEFFSSYELTHEGDKKGSQPPPKGGCLSGCATLIFLNLGIFSVILFFITKIFV